MVMELLTIFSSKWQKVTELIGNKCEGRVPDLAENMKYTFRVIAVNKGGFSKPSEPSDPIVTKDRNGIILKTNFFPILELALKELLLSY